MGINTNYFNLIRPRKICDGGGECKIKDNIIHIVDILSNEKGANKNKNI